jgi:hypothetical protein
MMLSSIAPTMTTTTSYKEVQWAFRKLALRYHPDTAGQQQEHNGDDENNKFLSFTEIREAFEAIVEGPNGEAILRDDNCTILVHNEARFRTTDNNNDNEMEINNNRMMSPSHDNNISDFLHPSINPQILREVAQVAEEMNPGGLDKGGMWQYANMINNMAKEEGRLPPLRVDGGVIADDEEGTTSGSGVAAKRRKRRK